MVVTPATTTSPLIGAAPSGAVIAPFPTVSSPEAAVDAVALSPEAQQALAAPGADDIKLAIAALNDASGKTSIEDQLQAYKLVADLTAKGDAAAGAALVDSPFAQRAQALLSAIGGLKDWSGGAKTADSFDRALAAFDSLSASDQQIYVGAIGLQHQMISGEAPNASVEDYRANQLARADVERALAAAQANPAYAGLIAVNETGGANGFYGRRDALIKAAGEAGDEATVELAKLSRLKPDTDDWTAQVQAHFAQYGEAPASGPSAGPVSISLSKPGGPDGKTLMAALATLNDTSGKAAVEDKLSANTLLKGYLAAQENLGPARLAIGKAYYASAFVQNTYSMDDKMTAGLGRGVDAPKTQLDRLNRMSDDDQKIYFALNSHDDKGAERFASLDSMKANLSTRSAINNLYEGLLARYGVDDESKINDPAFTNSKMFKALQDLHWTNDQSYDSWTKRAQAFLDDLKDEPLTKSPAEQTSEEAAAAKALETLKQVAESQKRFNSAIRSPEWKIDTYA